MEAAGPNIDTVSQLEAVIGRTPPAMHLKVIDHLDAGALGWIAQSPLMFAGFGNGGRTIITVGGGAQGFATGDTGRLRLPLAALDDADGVDVGAPFGSLFLIPGIGEALRINGVVEAIEGDHLHIAVRECYGHCAKAIIRSALWAADPCEAPTDIADFVVASRFLALATIGASGQADISPKGDPAGCMVQMDGDRLWFADRPGNRRADSFRNIVERSSVAIGLLVPGGAGILRVTGAARLTTDEAIRRRFCVQDKTPLLAVEVHLESAALSASPAWTKVAPWPLREKSDINPTKLFMDHVRLNRSGGLGGKLARATLALPGMQHLAEKGLEKDYKDNLY